MLIIFIFAYLIVTEISRYIEVGHDYCEWNGSFSVGRGRSAIRISAYIRLLCDICDEIVLILRLVVVLARLKELWRTSE